MKKTWLQKLKDKKSFPKIIKMEKHLPCYNALHKMGVKERNPVVLVNTSEIISLMAKVPKGKIITIREICRKIAENHRVKGCCSLTTGIFIMTIANAIQEAINNKDKLMLTNKIPYWRTLKAEGFLNEKYPGGLESHKKLLKHESHKIIAKGKKYQVVDWEKFLIQL